MIHQQEKDDCLKVKITSSAGEDSSSIKILSQNELSIDIKDQKSVNSNLQQTIASVGKYMGITPFGLKFYKSTDMTFNQISAIHVTLFYSDATLKKDTSKQRAQVRELVMKQLKDLAIQKLGIINEDQIFINERVLSASNKKLVNLSEGRLQIGDYKFLKFADSNGII